MAVFCEGNNTLTTQYNIFWDLKKFWRATHFVAVFCEGNYIPLYIKSESTEFYCEQKCKSAAAIAKAQSGIAFKSITDPPSSFSSLKMTETC